MNTHARPSRETTDSCRARDVHWEMPPELVPGLVSVIVPTYNRRHLVLEALESVVAQTYRPIELIVVDDGSTDGTAEAVEAWFHGLGTEWKAGFQLRLLRQANGGPSRARNCGLAASRGEFIQFLDSDDILHPNKLETHVSHLRADPALAYIYSLLVTFTSVLDWNAKPLFEAHEVGELHTYLTTAFLLPNLGLYRRSTCLAVGPYNEALTTREDIEYSVRLILSGSKIAFIPWVGVANRQHDGERASRAPAAAVVNALKSIVALVTNSGTRDARALEALAHQCFKTGLERALVGDRRLAHEAARRGLDCSCSWSRRAKLRGLALLTAPTVPDVLRRGVIQAAISAWWMILALGLVRTADAGAKGGPFP